MAWHMRIILAALLIGSLISAAALAQGTGPKMGIRSATQVVSLENGFIRVIMADDGSFVLGTTGGDPFISGDEDKPLLFGYPNGPYGTGYPSLRVIRGGIISDTILIQRPLAFGPARENNTLVTRWLVDGVEVTQRISLRSNPYTNRDDQALIAYTLRNVSSVALQAGARCLLDMAVGSFGQPGSGDDAPFFLPGVGNVMVEREFSASNMPDYFKAFESPVYAPDSLRAQGILKGYGMTTPERLVLATWQRPRGGGEGIGIYLTAWDYTVTPNARLGDSAVGLYWGPRSLDPGQEVTFQTSYGLGGAGGGQAWIEAPARLECSNLRFTANLWVSNTSTETLMNGQATISLPAGLRLAAGQNPTLSGGNVPPREVRTVNWVIEADARRAETLAFNATVTFDNLSDPFRPQASIAVPNCTPNTPVPTSPPPTPVPTPPPEIPEPGSLILLGVGLAGLALRVVRRRR